MANICTNHITITGDPELINIVAKEYLGYDETKDDFDFNFAIMSPIPDEYLNDDYHWRIQNWGNKWDGSDAYAYSCEDQISLHIDTAWSPCEPWTYKLIELCPGLDIYHEYYEPGEGYIGWISHNGGDDPEDFEQADYSYSNDEYEYWYMVFEKEYESYEWLSDRIDDCLEDEIITEEVAKELENLMEQDELGTLIRRCVEEEVL